MNDGNRYATLMFGILIGLALGIVIGMWFPPSTFKIPEACTSQAFWCWLDRWQTLVAGSFALIAAVTAWIAIDRQIKAHREETHRTALEVRGIAEERVKSVLNDLNWSWKICEDIHATINTMDHTERTVDTPHFQAFFQAYSRLQRINWDREVADITALASDMLPNDKMRFTGLLQQYERLRYMLERPLEDFRNPDKEDIEDMPLWRDWLEHIMSTFGGFGEAIRTDFPNCYPEIKNRQITTVRDMFGPVDIDYTASFKSVLRGNNPF